MEHRGGQEQGKRRKKKGLKQGHPVLDVQEKIKGRKLRGNANEVNGRLGGPKAGKKWGGDGKKNMNR